MIKQELYLILHNIRSAYNVGSIFRTADGAGVSKIYLCGITPTPTTRTALVNSKITKTALGAEKNIPWEHNNQTWVLLKKLKKDGVGIVALEQNKKSMNYLEFKPKFPLALIVGNEVSGLSKNILKYTDKIIAIPVYGKKESLNVSVATGIALYKIIENIK